MDPYGLHRKRSGARNLCPLDTALKVRSAECVTLSEPQKLKIVPGAGLCQHCFRKIQHNVEHISIPTYEDSPPTPSSAPGNENDNIPVEAGPGEQGPRTAIPQQALEEMETSYVTAGGVRPMFSPPRMEITSSVSSIHSDDDILIGADDDAIIEGNNFQVPIVIPVAKTVKSDKTSTDTNTDSESSAGSSAHSSGSVGLAKLNELLATQKISPVSKRRAKRGKGYCKAKVAKVTYAADRVMKKIAGHSVDINQDKNDVSEILTQLKERFRQAKTRHEIVQILSVLPQSWSVQRVVDEFEEFGVTAMLEV